MDKSERIAKRGKLTSLNLKTFYSEKKDAEATNINRKATRLTLDKNQDAKYKQAKEQCKIELKLEKMKYDKLKTENQKWNMEKLKIN